MLINNKFIKNFMGLILNKLLLINQVKLLLIIC